MVEEKKTELKEKKVEDKTKEKNGTQMNTDNTDAKKIEKKNKQDFKDEKDSGKKDEKKEKKVHEKAVANGFGLKISPKYSKAVCRMIRGKTVEMAVLRLKEVIDKKRAVPMAGLEVAHQKGKGLAGAKFPVNACKEIMEIVKQAGANAVQNGVENGVIVQAISNRASEPYRRAGRKAKRTHIYIEVRDRTSVVGGRKSLVGRKSRAAKKKNKMEKKE